MPSSEEKEDIGDRVPEVRMIERAVEPSSEKTCKSRQTLQSGNGMKIGTLVRNDDYHCCVIDNGVAIVVSLLLLFHSLFILLSYHRYCCRFHLAKYNC